MIIVTTCDLLSVLKKNCCFGVDVSCKRIFNLDNFFLLNQGILECINFNLEENVKAKISQHLERLRESFNGYFSLEDQEETEA